MLFGPAQIMQWLDISEETLRHWKKRLPPIERLNGYKPCFSHADVLALAIVKCFVQGLDMRVSALRPIARELFEQCRRINWMRAEHRFFLVDLQTNEIEVCDDLNTARFDRVRVVVPVDSLLDELRQRVLSSSSDEPQQELKLPPVSIGRKALP